MLGLIVKHTYSNDTSPLPSKMESLMPDMKQSRKKKKNSS